MDQAAPITPFLGFASCVQPQTVARARITAACRIAEEEAVAMLLPSAMLAPAQEQAAQALTRTLVAAIRRKIVRGGGVEGLIKEYDLSSDEGVALMCLAEALLRIPDHATRDALIRDKIGRGNWQAHLGQSPSLFVNAATWGLLVTGKLTATSSETGLAASLAGLIGRGGEPLIRRGVDMAMRMMGEQFVTGQTIGEALDRSRKPERQGYRYSYDMLGEAALTADDAAGYYKEYEAAIHAIGAASRGRGIYEGPGISVKLSALHPRYSRAQRERVMAELLPRLTELAKLARHYDIGLNIDAEESERLELSLDLLEALCLDGALEGWSGIGFVVQAYQKRAPFVIDWVIALARRTQRRIMLRLVKGAYWDSEIKRAQQDGLDGFPVYTRKAHTDVSYLACARRLLAAPDAVFAQFATHNARTLAAIHAMAGPNFYAGQYEFQCLHGMGEPLYEEVVGHNKLNRPCRIYAPVGTHETLLAYLVRRLLENGANTSFVNRIGDPAISLDALSADPAALVAASLPVGAAEPRIALPRDLFGDARINSEGLDLASEQRLASVSAALLASVAVRRIAQADEGAMSPAPVRNPADHADQVGEVSFTSCDAIDVLVARAVAAASGWSQILPGERAAILDRAAAALQASMQSLLGLIVRESGKILVDAVGEVREAVDFLHYYAACIRGTFRNDTHRPLGVVVCISPWNFPQAIFVGQIAAALAAGNAVLAKPAEQTPLIAAEAVRLLHRAGVPQAALQLVPGAGEIGAALVAHPSVAGVMFTGSTEVARSINRTLAARADRAAVRPIPLVAETGGQNAMIVDSSALVEQVVTDVVQSAFNSAGQRCSALRLLCVQDDVAPRVVSMLQGAMQELLIGPPDLLSTDIGPVIDDAARDAIVAHIENMRVSGRRIFQLDLPDGCGSGTFVAPCLIEIDTIAALGNEVFGPVLHVLRYARDRLDGLLAEITATGYALTFGVHTRIDETIAHVSTRAAAGNLYVNRNIVGAVVGVQPFGGHGLSGTGPKAGGPLTLRRLLSQAPVATGLPAGRVDPDLLELIGHLDRIGCDGAATLGRRLAAETLLGSEIALPGPVGESNRYSLQPRAAVICHASSETGLAVQLACAIAAGASASIERHEGFDAFLRSLPERLQTRWTRATTEGGSIALFEGDGEALDRFCIRIAQRDGPIVPVLALSAEEIAQGSCYPTEFLFLERCVSVNTAAAGGNASLMSVG